MFVLLTERCKFPNKRAQYRARNSDFLSLPVDADLTLVPDLDLNACVDFKDLRDSMILGVQGGFRATLSIKIHFVSLVSVRFVIKDDFT